MSVRYSGVYAYRSKFDGEYFEESDHALEHDFHIAAGIIEEASREDLMNAAQESPYGEKSELRKALEFLMEAGERLRYSRKEQADAA